MYKSQNSLMITILLSSSLFMIVLDFSIVTIALPAIQLDFHISPSIAQWIMSAYSISFGGVLLLSGRCADVFGRRRLFLLGLLLFMLTSLAGGLAQYPLWLIIARAVQGLAASLLAPASLSLITTTFPEGTERNRALAIYGTSASAGYVVGVILGGILTFEGGWRWVFFVNVPIGMIVILLALIFIRESQSHNTSKHLDLAGTVTIVTALIILIYALTSAIEQSILLTGFLFLLSSLLIATFVIIEMRTYDPLIPLSIFRHRTLTGASMVTLFWAMTSSAWIILLALYLQTTLAYSPLQASLFFLPQGIMSIATGLSAKQVITRLGVKRVIVWGMFVFACGSLIVTRISPQGDTLMIVLLGTVFGSMGGSWAVIALSIAATTGVGNKDQGLVSGILNTMQQIGGSLGVAITIMVDTILAHPLGNTNIDRIVLVQGYQGGLVACFIFLLLGLLIATTVLEQDKVIP